MNQDVKRLNRFCVVCGRELGPLIDTHCTNKSVVALKREGFFKKRVTFFALDGTPLSDHDIAQLKEAELPRTEAQRKLKHDEVARLEARSDKRRSDAITSVRSYQPESYYGLSVLPNTNNIKYSGAIQTLELEGSEIHDFVVKLLDNQPSAHLLVVGQIGLVIVIKSAADFLAFQFTSPLSVANCASLVTSMLSKGRRPTMVEKYGAIELV